MHHGQQNGGALPHALYTFQFFHAGAEYALQRAELLQQKVGRGVGVAAGDGVKQQQFQRLMVGETIQSRLDKLLLFSGAMAVMDAHLPSLLAINFDNFAII